MRESLKKYRDIILLFSGIVLVLLSTVPRDKITIPEIKLSRQDIAYNFNDSALVYFTGGQKRLVTALLWIFTLLDSDEEHYRGENLLSWMYLRFNTISNFEPLFYESYFTGGTYLAVIKDDPIGAEKIYKKGLKLFPDDFALNYKLGNTLYLDLYKPKEALKYFKKILYYPEVKNRFFLLPSIVARIEAEASSLQGAYELLLQNFETNTDPRFKKRYQENLYSLKAEIDLNCLNKTEENKSCSTKDYYEKPYILKNGKYHAQIDWIPFRPGGQKIRDKLENNRKKKAP